jgi:hypothetical protein
MQFPDLNILPLKIFVPPQGLEIATRDDLPSPLFARSLDKVTGCAP